MADNVVPAAAAVEKCMCGENAALTCAKCKMKICDDINCGQETVNGYLCGTYTQWGCSKKYTTCDICQDDAAFHEADLTFCGECGNGMCNACLDDAIECDKCEAQLCESCTDLHECD
jgi:hypothetical protein